MIEHRLIEKVLRVAQQRAESTLKTDYNPVFVETVVDFIKVYADRTHHGKEEDILFAELQKKRLGESDARIMAELVEEHSQARARVREIVELNESYKKGNGSVAARIADLILWLAAFYPVHIKKEDRRFFPDTERYFSGTELEDLLARFREFDQQMIHEKYRKVYEAMT